MSKTRKRVLSYLILLTFVLTNILGTIGAIPVHAEETEKTIPSEDEQILDGQAIRGIPDLISKPASEEDISYLAESESRISLRILPALNSDRTFYAYNPETYLYDSISSTLKRIGAHSYIYLEDGITGVTDEKLDEIVDEFEYIYRCNASVFGTPPDIDNDKRINILLMDIRDDSSGGSYIAGFFDSTNQLPRISGYNVPSDQSNECEIFYMDVNEGLPNNPTKTMNFFGTLAHEFQHMIQYGTYLSNYTFYNQMEETWLNEALSCLAEYINFSIHTDIRFFLSDYLPEDVGLTDWGSSLADYGASYMFALYMYEKLGESFISALAADPEIGIESIETQLIANGENMSFDELFEKSQVAIIVDDDDPNTDHDAGDFAFDTINIPEIRQASYDDPTSIPEMWFYHLIPSSGNYNATQRQIRTWGGSYRSYAGMLDGEYKATDALSVAFENDTGSYYLVKPSNVSTVANTYASFTAASKTIEKIQPNTIGGNIIELGDNQWAMLIYIAHEIEIDNIITVSETGTAGPDAVPSTPTNVTYEEGYNHISLEWDPSEYTGGIQGYNVYRDGSPTPINPSLIQTTSYTDLTVDPGTAYDYQIEAVGRDANKSAKTDVLTAYTESTPDLTAPNPPSITFQAKGNGYIDINITKSDSPDVSHYEVITMLDRMEDNAYRYDDTADPLDIRLDDLTNDVVYTIYAFAVDNGGNYSVASNKIHAVAGIGGGEVILSTPPTVPTGVTATSIKETKVSLQWTASTQTEGILEYNVYRDGVFAGKTAGNATQFTDTGLKANTDYKYRVEAVGNDAENLNSTYSVPYTVTTTLGPPVLNADATNNDVDNILEITFIDNPTWRSSITAIQADGVDIDSSKYSIVGGTITINAGAITAAKTYTITVIADGYSNRGVTQSVRAGAANAASSTVSIDQPLSLGTTRTVTLTAKDQYNNPVSGHRFYADVTVINNVETSNESYTVHSTGYTASASNISVGNVTSIYGQTTVQIAVPAAVDTDDGVTVQFKAASGGANIGSAVSCKGAPALTADSTENNVDNELQITFADNPTWRSAIGSVKVGSTTLLPAQYSLVPGFLTLSPGAVRTAGNNTISIIATGYINATVIQAVSAGAVNAAQSTASANQSLAPGVTGTITLAARDQYGNPVQGHQFYMDISVINNNTSSTESYTVAGNTYTASASGIAAGSITGANGETLIGITIPSSVDINDGISIQFILTDSGANVGGAIGYIRPNPPPPPAPSGKSRKGGGGGGGGGGTSPATTTPGATVVTAGLINEQLNNKSTSIVTINIGGTSNKKSASIPADVLSSIDNKGKKLSISTNEVNMTFSPKILGSGIGTMAKDSSLTLNINKLSPEDASALSNTSTESKSGLFRVNNSIYQFDAKLIGKDKTTNLTSFSEDITITIFLTDTDPSAIDSEKLGVYYFNEKSKTWQYVGGKYDPATKSITFTTNHFSYYTVMKYEKTFSDIKDHWAKADIEKLASRHVFTNIAKEQFKPQAKVTRAEFIAMLVRALELKYDGIETVAFKDITKDKYYYGEVMTAWKLGITTGDDGGKFRPGDNITREQLAAMIVRALGYLKKSPVLTEAQVSEKLNAYTDKDSVSSYARNSMAIVLEKKIINGWRTDLLAPKENATRAEAAVMLQRLLNGL